MNQPPFAEYPRPEGPSHNASGRGPGVYFEAIGEAWNLVMQDLGHWTAATIVYFVITWALSLPIGLLTGSLMPQQPRFDQLGQMASLLGIQLVLNLIPASVSAVLVVGMISMGVRKARGEYINVGMIFEPFRRFGSVVGAAGLYYIVIFAASLTLIVPVLFFGPVLLFTPLLAFLKGTGPVQSLGLSFDSCKAHWLGLLALSLVLTLIYIAGFLACCVGVLIAFPLICVVIAIHYRAFFESSAPAWP